MAVGDAYVFPGCLTPVLTQLFFPKPPTSLTCFCRGERIKYVGKRSRLNQGLNSQPQGHESDTLSTEPLRAGLSYKEQNKHASAGLHFIDIQCKFKVLPFTRRQNFTVLQTESICR